MSILQQVARRAAPSRRFLARRMTSAPQQTPRPMATGRFFSRNGTAARNTLPAVIAPLAPRTLKTLSFGAEVEEVVERSDYPPSRIQELLGDDVVLMLGYGTQGRGQALNMRDNGLNVIVGLRKGASWDRALSDGWKEGETLFEIDEAMDRATVVCYLLSDAGQASMWPTIAPKLTPGKTLYFSHGFSVVYKDDTKVIPPSDIDVILVAPKGSGTTVRSLFLEGRGINASVAVYQDVSGKAKDRANALGVAAGCGYLYETTFQKEVYSDLTGERGILMGAIYGAFLAQYEVLRAKGHSPSEAFNETVEEATQSLYPLIGANGMDWMYANCSQTAQRGALDWYPEFHKATKPVFERLYDSVESGEETRRVLDINSRADVHERLAAELKEIREHEMWRAGAVVRSLRPENISSANEKDDPFAA